MIKLFRLDSGRLWSAVRSFRGISIKRLAQAADVSPQTIYRVLTTARASKGTAAALAKALYISFDELVKGEAVL